MITITINNKKATLRQQLDFLILFLNPVISIMMVIYLIIIAIINIDNSTTGFFTIIQIKLFVIIFLCIIIESIILDDLK